MGFGVPTPNARCSHFLDPTCALFLPPNLQEDKELERLVQSTGQSLEAWKTISLLFPQRNAKQVKGSRGGRRECPRAKCPRACVHHLWGHDLTPRAPLHNTLPPHPTPPSSAVP